MSLSRHKRTEMYHAEKQRNILSWYLYKCSTLSKEDYVALVNEIPIGEHYVMSNYPAWRFRDDIVWQKRYNNECELEEISRDMMIKHLTYVLEEADKEYRRLWEQDRT